MNREEILQQVTMIFCDVFDDDEIIVKDSTTAVDIPGWDSLMQIELIHAHETHFGFKFGMKEILSMNNVGEMIDLIEEKTSL